MSGPVNAAPRARQEPAALRAFSRALGWLSALTITVAGVALVFVLVNLPSVAIWAAMGHGLRGVLQDHGRRRLFNRVMAVLLVASMLPVLSGH